MAEIVHASKYAQVPARSAATPGPGARASALHRAPQVLIRRKARRLDFREFMWREMKEGRYLHEILRREKATSQMRVRAVARTMQHFRQNPKSDWRLMGAIPLREYIRWKAEDPNFFRDDKNLRSLKRDNPDLPIYV